MSRPSHDHPLNRERGRPYDGLLKTLTIFWLCRAFLTRTYPTMKKHNPSTPIMLREAQGTLPKVYARYEFGKEKSQSLEGTHSPEQHNNPVLSSSRMVAIIHMSRRARWARDWHDG